MDLLLIYYYIVIIIYTTGSISTLWKLVCDKSYLLLNYSEPFTLETDGFSIEQNLKEALLRITIDGELNFDDHPISLCKKEWLKLLLAMHPSWGALRITYNDGKSSFFKDLFNKKTVTIHHKNIKNLEI